MSFRTGTPAVDPHSHAGQRHVSSETVHRDAAERSVTRPHPRVMARRRRATLDAAESPLRCDDAATTVAAMVGDEGTAAVTLNIRGNVAAVIYATGSPGLLVRPDPSCKQR
jgi:hypothetical protein